MFTRRIIHAHLSSLRRDFEALFEDMIRQLAAQREENSRLRAALQQANSKNIEASRAASIQLQLCLANEKRVSQQERQQLKDQIFELFDASASGQDERISSSIARTQRQLNESNEAFHRADKAYAEGIYIERAQDRALVDKVSGTRDELQAKMKKDWTVSHTFVGVVDANDFQEVSARSTTIQLSTKAVHGETVKVVDGQLGEMSTQMSTPDEFVTEARDQSDKSHEQHIGGLHQFQLKIAQLQTDLFQTIEEREIDLQSLENGSQSATIELAECTRSFCGDAEEDIATVKKTN